MRAGLRLDTVAITDRALSSPEGRQLADRAAAAGAAMVQVSETVMAAMSPVASPSGVVAIAGRPDWTLDQVFERIPQLVVVAVDVQEPGNVGAIVRAAEACGATGAAFCGASADPFGWKALRGSMGSALRLPLASVVVNRRGDCRRPPARRASGGHAAARRTRPEEHRPPASRSPSCWAARGRGSRPRSSRPPTFASRCRCGSPWNR